MKSYEILAVRNKVFSYGAAAGVNQYTKLLKFSDGTYAVKNKAWRRSEKHIKVPEKVVEKLFISHESEVVLEKLVQMICWKSRTFRKIHNEIQDQPQNA